MPLQASERDHRGESRALRDEIKTVRARLGEVETLKATHAASALSLRSELNSLKTSADKHRESWDLEMQSRESTVKVGGRMGKNINQ